jgi:Transposase DDE domain group 1
VLRDQERLFGQVASIPTIWRSLNETDHQGMARIALVRNRVRERMWALIEARHGAIPPSRTCYRDLGPVVVIRIDASLVASHSEKQHAAGNFKGGYGFHPLLAWCDSTGELLAVICRPGNAGSNTAADHIAIIDCPPLIDSKQQCKLPRSAPTKAFRTCRRRSSRNTPQTSNSRASPVEVPDTVASYAVALEGKSSAAVRQRVGAADCVKIEPIVEVQRSRVVLPDPGRSAKCIFDQRHSDCAAIFVVFVAKGPNPQRTTPCR